jgi:hypothetical protein
VTCVLGQPAARAVSSLRGQRRVSIARLPRQGLAPISGSVLILNIAILLLAKPCVSPMNRRLVPSPCSPPDRPIRPRERRKSPPASPRRQAASKWLIYMVLSRMAGSNLSAESMIRPVCPLLQGSGKLSESLAYQRCRHVALAGGTPSWSIARCRSAKHREPMSKRGRI